MPESQNDQNGLDASLTSRGCDLPIASFRGEKSGRNGLREFLNGSPLKTRFERVFPREVTIG